MARMFSCPSPRTCQLIITKPANPFSFCPHKSSTERIAPKPGEVNYKRRKFCYAPREAKRDDQIKAVWFAAGTAALMACIERATVVSLFAHWRVWAFLVLNLLLLAILFTSKSQTSYPNHSSETQDDNADPELEKKKKMQLWQPHVSTNVITRVQFVENATRINCEEDGKLQEEAQFEFTKDELNERVENFITMFRQHLVSDSKISCSSKRTSGRLN